MTTPLPWSHTALEDFVNCPRAYYEKRVAKSVKDEETEAMRWGTRVHKMFEDRQKFGVKKSPLPDDMQVHEILMYNLDMEPGVLTAEQKVGLDRRLNPCSFFDKQVWFRGIIDWMKVDGDRALVVDYKTGKVHSKFKQLALFALHTFQQYPEVNTVKVKYYWTQAVISTPKEYTRDQIPELWRMFVPDLKQYVEAFKTDTWQPRQSGLCNGWCPVTACEFWKPKRNK